MPVLKSTVRNTRPTPSGSFNRALIRLLLVILSVVTVIGISAWLWSINWPQQQASRVANVYYKVTAAAGFKVRDVIVEGRQSTDNDELLKTLNIERGTPILAFDPAAALIAVKQLPWVADAAIERRLPDTIYVNIFERLPVARWQLNGQTKVIDNTGAVLPQADPAKFPALPLVVGKGAAETAAELFVVLKRFPDLTPLIRSASRISERRWDLQFADDVTVKLPEEGIEAALARLSKLVKDQKIMARSITAIDLRQQDRITVETPNPVGPPPKSGEPKI